jgi:nucleotide-binding universal stress UspA family protein
MKKILVPTDFSQLSQVAVVFAVHLAEKMKAEVIVASVIDSSPAQDKSLPRWKKLADQLEEAAEKNAKQLLQEVKSQVDYPSISYVSLSGYPMESAIDDYAKMKNIDLIVVGTRGATGLKKVVLGSNAAAIIDNSSVPVITIPAETKFKPWNKIVYATDLTHIEQEIKPILRFGEYFGSEIHILHVLPTDSEKTMREIKEDTAALEDLANVHFHFVKSNNIAEEVELFVKEKKADVLVTFTHKLDFYEKLLGRSVTRELTFHSHLPLLTFNRTTLQTI